MKIDMGLISLRRGNNLDTYKTLVKDGFKQMILETKLLEE